MNDPTKLMHEQHISQEPENMTWLGDITSWRRDTRRVLALSARLEALLREQDVLLEEHEEEVRRQERHRMTHESEMYVRRGTDMHGHIDSLDIEHQQMLNRRAQLRELHNRLGVREKRMLRELQRLVDMLEHPEKDPA